MSLYRFKSRETSDLVMLQPHGQRILEALGKDPDAPGIIQPAEMADDIRQRILWYEPRLHPAHLEVRPVSHGSNPHFNTLRFEVVSFLLSNPVRDFQVRTEIDLETGEARLLP